MHHKHHQQIDDSGNAKVRDPVCGMMIDPARAAGKFDYQGQTYYFCNPGCLKKFQADPESYLTSPKPGSPVVSLSGLSTENPSDSATARSIYTCPMHPEVRQNGPDTCPKCGMGLEPEQPMVPQTTTWTCPMHPQI